MPYVPPAGNSVALRFRSTYYPPAGNAVPLPFGVLSGASITAQGQTSSGTGIYLPAIVATGVTQQANVSGGAAIYLAPVHRYLFAQAAARWRPGTSADRELQLQHRSGTPTDDQRRARWQRGTPRDRALDLGWQRPAHTDAQTGLRLTHGDALDVSQQLPWGNGSPADDQRRVPMQRADATDALDARLPWHNPPARDRQTDVRWSRTAALDLQAWLAASVGIARDRQSRLPWHGGRAPDWVYIIRPPSPPEPPSPPACYTPLPGNRVALRFRGLYTPPAGNAVPVPFSCRVERRFDLRRTLTLQHSLSVVRASDSLPLRVRSVSMSIDRDSWTWSVSIAFADASSSIAVEPTPAAMQDVEITLDGYVWVATIESVSEDRALNQRDCSATGRSRTALEAAPYQPQRAYSNPSPATAQQLAQRELDFSGYTLDWQIDDWTVPAGAWAYSAETPISAITKIATAAGAMIQSAPDSDTIIIRPRLPAAPWAFDSLDADFVLAGGSWLKKGKRYASGGRYNGAVVTGQQQGVNVIVYRDGTAGSPYAQQIVDPLITETAPAVARGTQIVADSMDRHEIPIELPLLPSPAAPGLLLPGELGEIEDTVWGTYRAVVDAVTISAEVSDDGLITARQSATLWRYLI